MFRGAVYGLTVAGIAVLAASSLSYAVVVPAVIVLGAAAAITLGGWRRAWPQSMWRRSN